jgi:hypothetical protein
MASSAMNPDLALVLAQPNLAFNADIPWAALRAGSRAAG